MKKSDLIELGIPAGEPSKLALGVVRALAREGKGRPEMESVLLSVVRDPAAHRRDSLTGALAEALAGRRYVPRSSPAPYHQWGDDLDPASIGQMANACNLPVSVAGALMPDAHRGYGLPIGGVLATENAVIPYAVGVDIACRMKLTVLDLPPEHIDERADALTGAIEAETRFGVGASFRDRRQHDVLDADWSVCKVTREKKDKAWAQLGTSGSGNHFVEFGLFTVGVDDGDGAGEAAGAGTETLGLAPGRYLALLSHSGSRGTGAAVCAHYSKVARESHPELPKELTHLAWLDLDAEDGQEYWAAMNLMGEYAAANHACIHRHVAAHLGAEVLLDLENHHNFAWKEEHGGREVVVHRKGATPAGEGVIGIIPGSMASPAYIVRGKGEPRSLKSAAHGAGRVMSRTQAVKTLKWQDARERLKRNGVTLLSAGLDEVPAVYKDIDQVMADQADLVDTLARFDPRIVKMAPHGERPED